MTARLPAALGLVCLGLLLGGGASATPPLASAPASAQAVAIELIGPGQTVIASTAVANAPPSGDPVSAAFAYPADGSVATAESTSVTTSASAVDGTASALAVVGRLSLFGGEITVERVLGSSSSAGTVGDLSDSTVSGLVVLGQPVATVAPGAKISLADWGYALPLGETIATGSSASPAWRGTITALVVHVDADHGGLPAGTEIRIGFADAYAQAPVAPTTTARTDTETVRTKPEPAPPTVRAASVGASVSARAAALGAGRNRFGPLLVPPSDITPTLTAKRYVFPIYGPAGFGDTFGAPRPDVSGGWHHGDDIFAPLGAPVLAVTDGTVFSVGWNDVGGYRLWLRDEGGNEFYYAHLSAYTTLAVNGRRVRAGDVLGFVGNTGDAEGTPFHLHFEIHPVSMLFLDYDGAVNPSKYLEAWKRLEDIRILPAIPFAPPAASSNAPTPGAFLLESTDISTASGLDPGSLTRAINGPPTVDPLAPGVVGLPVPLPVLDRA